jgi:hypothetical protein
VLWSVNPWLDNEVIVWLKEKKKAVYVVKS